MFAYNVAGTKIHIETSNSYLTNRMKAFECSECEIPDISVEIEECSHISKPIGHLLISENIKWLKKDDDAGFHIYSTDRDEKQIISDIETNNEWSSANIRWLKQEIDENASDRKKILSDIHTFMLTGIIFRNCLLNKGGIVMHASSIAWNDKGLLFTAPSGTGKSTHVRLWEKYFGESVSVVNDDTPAIRFIDDVPMLCGTPWSGSSDKFENITVPIKGIVVLNQSPVNSIKRLNSFEALQGIMPRCFLPYFDENMMLKAYTVLENIINSVPVYHLDCRPDKEAMELVYECVR